MHSMHEILQIEGLQDWKIKKIYSGGGLCLHSQKEIWLDKKNWNIPFLLHEIAHAKLSKTHHHDAIWGDLYTQLIIKYWKQ